MAVLACAGVVLFGAMLWSTRTDSMLGAFSTSLEGRNPEQLANIRLAAGRINGHQVLPGQTFSMADALGPTEPSHGWKSARAVVRGQMQDAVAGGICQVSSTLYNAVLLAGLDVTERHAHSVPVQSVPPGRDATVAWGVADLRFRNTRNSNVRIRASAAGHRLTVSLQGAGPAPPRARITSSSQREDGRIVATVWRETPDGGREMISRDEYQAGP